MSATDARRASMAMPGTLQTSARDGQGTAFNGGEAGIARMAVSLDGADAATHDRMRAVPGSIDQTQLLLRDAR